MARLIGIARNTLTARSGRRTVDAALGPLVRILVTAVTLAGDEHAAAIWFKHQPISAFGGRSAYDLVSEGKADAVRDYLESMRAGAHT